MPNSTADHAIKKSSLLKRVAGAIHHPAKQESVPAKRAAYTPTHAASDFVRLGGTPPVPPPARARAPKKRSSTPPPVPPIDTRFWKEKLAMRDSQTSRQNEKATPAEPPAMSGALPAKAEPAKHLRQASVQSHPLPAMLSSSNPAPQPPIPPSLAWPVVRPVTPIPSRCSTDLLPTPYPSSISLPEPRPKSMSQPPSDYEQFLAEAEADDRALRGEVWRTINAVSPSSSAGPSPHLQFVTHKGGKQIKDLSRKLGGQGEGLAKAMSQGNYGAVMKMQEASAPKERRASASDAGAAKHGVGGRRMRAASGEKGVAQRIVEYIRSPREKVGRLRSASLKGVAGQRREY